METELPAEIAAALTASNGCLRVIDPKTRESYVLVDSATHERAMHALQQVQEWNCIQEGIEQANRGETISLEQMDSKIRNEFGFSPRA